MSKAELIIEFEEAIKELEPLLEQRNEKMKIVIEGAINKNVDEETLEKIIGTIKEEIQLRKDNKVS